MSATCKAEGHTVQPAYKVVQIQGMSAYSVRSAGPDSCVCVGIGTGKSRLYGFSGYRGGPEPFHISGLHCNILTTPRQCIGMEMLKAQDTLIQTMLKAERSNK